MASSSTKKESFPEQFHKYITQELASLNELVTTIKETPLSERKAALDDCATRIEKLAKEVREASSTGSASFGTRFDGGGKIPARDQKTYLDGVKKVMERLRSVRNQKTLSSGTRFGMGVMPTFTTPLSDEPDTKTPIIEKREEKKQIQAEEDSTITDINSTLRSSSSGIQDADFSSSKSLTLTQHTSLLVRPSQLPGLDRYSAVFTNISSSFIDVSRTSSSHPTNLTLKNIEKSILLCGTINGPAHITGLNNVILVVKCKQFRMHECTGTKVYLSCGSKPVVEDVKDVEFAPLPEAFMQEQEKGSDMWDKVQDFKWVKLGPSPNWRLLPAENRLTEDEWKKIKEEEVNVNILDVFKLQGDG